jgi:hypothetical protein
MQIKYSNVSISDSGWDSTGQISSLCLLFTCGARSLLFCSKATHPWEPIPINQVLSWRRFLVLVTRQIENITAAISRSAQLQAHNDTEEATFLCLAQKQTSSIFTLARHKHIFTFMVTRSTQDREKSSSRSPACHTISSLPRQNERAARKPGEALKLIYAAVRAPGFWRQKITPSSVGGQARARNNYLFFLCIRIAKPRSDVWI